MVMVASSRKEQGARVGPDGLRQSESPVVETRSLVQIVDAEVNVAHRCSRRYARPRSAPASGHHVLHVQRISSHVELPALVPPCLTRAIGVNFDAQPIGVGEVYGLAHGVIGKAYPDAKRN